MQKDERVQSTLLKITEDAKQRLEANQGRLPDAMRLVISSMRFFLTNEGLNWEGRALAPWEMYNGLWSSDILFITGDTQKVRKALIAAVMGLYYWLFKFPEAEEKANEALEILEAT